MFYRDEMLEEIEQAHPLYFLSIPFEPSTGIRINEPSSLAFSLTDHRHERNYNE